MTLTLRFGDVERVIRSTGDHPGILVVLAGSDEDDPFEHQWAIDPSYEPPNSPLAVKAQILGAHGQTIQTSINGTEDEIRARVIPLTIAETVEAAAPDKATLFMLLMYAQATLVSVMQRWGQVHVYEAVGATARWCAEVRDAIAEHLPELGADPAGGEEEVSS